MQLEQLELENKFVFDQNTWMLFGNKKPPPRFTNKPTPWHTYVSTYGKDVMIIKGRIFPKTEPYCRASFLIEIILPRTFPFQPPDVFFRDPIYHPTVDGKGYHCCCCRDILGNKEWAPTTRLTTVIEAVIRNIDNISETSPIVNSELFKEYMHNRQTFYKNALRCTLTYGRPRI
jgi:ubiquitin-conjugating enzyme E2 L3